MSETPMSWPRDPSLAPPVASTVGWTGLDVRAVDTARVLAADAVQKVGNGHPGTAMSLAPAAYLLYHDVMRLDPADPQWLGRDRFVLSNGHSSLTQYVQLYLSGIGLELADLEALRTYRSKTPGHPEVHHTTGVEVTTGPLGSGLASAVGMAMAQRRQRGLFDPEAPAGQSPFDHHIYAIAGDGCLQEGVASEACSLAGHQKLGNLTLIYDANRISIEDRTDIAFSEDVAGRFAAYGWDVRRVSWFRPDAPYVEDVDALAAAIEAGRQVTDRPTLVILDTIIAWPAPTLQDTGKSHGAALGEKEVAATKTLLGFDPEADFAVDPAVIAHTRGHLAERARADRERWDRGYDAWRAAHPERAALLDRVREHRLPDGFAEALPTFPADAAKGLATRAASGKVLTALAAVMPELWGGSADLAESNNTTMEGEPSFVPTEHQTKMWQGNPYGRTLHFGIRENAMGMILNGISLEGLTRPYGGTFLTFSDYMRPAVRLAALQRLPVVFVWTHDSIGLGEDGPTHQPIEHIPSLRLIPNLQVVRPADANETVVAWRTILSSFQDPKALLLSRQALPVLDRATYAAADGAARGGYVLACAATDGRPDVILMATGSEVQHAVGAYEALVAEGVRARVVSMPCWEWFEAQDEAYRESVLPAAVRARVAVEAAEPRLWRGYVGDDGVVIGIDHYGESASGSALMERNGFTAEHVVAAARQAMSRRGADEKEGD